MKSLIFISVSGLVAVPLLLFPKLTEFLATPTFFLVLMLAFSFPHFMSSYLIFYKDAQLRRKHVLIAWVLPLSLLVGLVLSGQWSETGVFWLLQGAYLLLHWHFAKQAYGVALWFQRKNSFPVLYRELCLAACLGIGFQGFLESQSAPTVLNVFKAQLPSFYLRSEVIEMGRVLMYLLVVIYLIYFLYHIVKQFTWRRVFSLLPVLSLFLWFQYRSFPGTYLLLIPVLHGLQYLPFALKALGTSFLKVVGVWAFAGVVFGMGPSLLGPLSLKFITFAGVLFVFLNVHHFFVDTVLWKSKTNDLVRDGF